MLESLFVIDGWKAMKSSQAAFSSESDEEDEENDFPTTSKKAEESLSEMIRSASTLSIKEGLLANISENVEKGNSLAQTANQATSSSLEKVTEPNKNWARKNDLSTVFFFIFTKIHKKIDAILKVATDTLEKKELNDFVNETLGKESLANQETVSRYLG